jgi:Mycothiol maleylpyruvate isomerase N-terminal domain
MTPPHATTELLSRLDQTWSDLTRTVATLDERDLAEPRDPAGWAAKDHLMHVAAWGEAFLASLDGRPRHEALGIDERTDREGDDDAINAAIFTRHRDRKSGEVVDALRATHTAVRARAAALEDPDVLAKIPGNTFEHYAEHLGYIRALVGHRAGRS